LAGEFIPSDDGRVGFGFRTKAASFKRNNIRCSSFAAAYAMKSLPLIVTAIKPQKLGTRPTRSYRPKMG